MVVRVAGEEKEKIEMATAIKRTKAQIEAKKKHPAVNKYDIIHTQLMDYLLSGENHTTLVGMIISMDHSNSDVSEVEGYVEYIISQLQQAEEYSNRKDNVN